ncbi:MAG: FHA domain-containing protein [Bryobacteraceae bacterium]|nr:FHA domain-containing protein [Bryobacteraceae bacterium]
MSFFRDLERSIDERLRGLFAAQPGQVKEAIEVHRMVLDAVECRVQMLPRAKRRFPYNNVLVRVPEDQITAFETLQTDIRDFFTRERIEFPSNLTVTLEPGAAPTVECREITPPVPTAGTVRFTLPDASTLDLSRTRIHVGRLADVLDDRHRLVRRNDLVLEGDTVSRAHAHIEFVDGAYRLFDDGSSYGTSAIHDGRLVEVPGAAGRGLRLHNGDEIYFGQARVRFDLI